MQCIIINSNKLNLVVYEDAVEYRNRRRNVGPVLHNERRLAAQPIPNTDLNSQAHAEESNTGRQDIEQNDDIESAIVSNHSDDESYDFSSLFENNFDVNDENGSVNEKEKNDTENEENENTSTNEEVTDENALVDSSAIDSVNNEEIVNSEDELQNSNENGATGSVMGMQPAEQEFWIDINPVIKQEVDPLQDDDALSDLLAENEVIQVADDVCMIVGFEGMPTPFVTNIDNMIKRENDPISHDIPFNYTVNMQLYLNWNM